MTVNWNFISSLEGKGICKAYVPCPGTSFSGITVATGFDLGQQSIESLKEFNLSPSLFRILKPYLGFQSFEAFDYIENYPLILTDKQVKEIDKAVQDKFTKDVSLYWSDWDKYSDALQTIIMSVSYQYGINLSKKCPKFYKACTSGSEDLVINELKTFGDKYGNRRCREADYLENSRVKDVKQEKTEVKPGKWDWLKRILS
jgi:hypothetical protein